MKRASNFWPRLKKLLQESNHDLVSGNNEIIFPEKTDFLKGASFGLVNLQIMHQLNTSEMIRGNLLTLESAQNAWGEIAGMKKNLKLKLNNFWPKSFRSVFGKFSHE